MRAGRLMMVTMLVAVVGQVRAVDEKVVRTADKPVQVMYGGQAVSGFQFQRDGRQITIIPAIEPIDILGFMADQRVNWQDSAELGKFLEGILPVQYAVTAGKYQRGWQAPRLFTNAKTQIVIIIFDDYLGADSSAWLEVRFIVDGPKLVVHFEYPKGDGENIVLNLWQQVIVTALPEDDDGGTTKRYFTQEVIPRCKCDKTGGSACTDDQCRGLKTCTTAGGPTGSCSYNQFQ